MGPVRDHERTRRRLDDIRVAVVLLAAGSGSRVGSATNKVYLPLAGSPVFAWSLRSALRLPGLRRCLLVIADQDRSLAEVALAKEAAAGVVELVPGGLTRHASEVNALVALEAEISLGALDVVVMHDAARPLATPALFSEVIRQANSSGGALPGRRESPLIAIGADDPSPGRTVTVQTPQAFRAAPLLQAYQEAGAAFAGTDTASCVERYTDLVIRWVPGSADNIKITFPHDLAVAEHLMARRNA